jgi:hypothetical protein
MRKNWQKMESYIQQNNFFSDNITTAIEAIRTEEVDAIIYDAVVLDYQASKDPKCELITGFLNYKL